MCRRSCLYGFGIIALGLGILVGYSIESWFWCTCISIGLMLAGFCLMRHR